MAVSDQNDTGVEKRTMSRIGYAIAVVGNLAFLFVVNNLLAWEWFPFLTDDFEQLLPIVNLSLIVGAIVNAALVLYNAQWFRSIGQIVQNVFGLFVVVTTLKVFPFDFSPYRINWTTITRVMLIMLAVVIGIGTIAEFVKLIRSLGGADQPGP